MSKAINKAKPENLDKASKLIENIVNKNPSDDFFEQIDKTQKNAYYKVMFDDGELDMELYPDEGDEDFEDYDNTNLKMVKKFAKKFKDTRIIEVMEREIL